MIKTNLFFRIILNSSTEKKRGLEDTKNKTPITKVFYYSIKELSMSLNKISVDINECQTIYDLKKQIASINNVSNDQLQFINPPSEKLKHIDDLYDFKLSIRYLQTDANILIPGGKKVNIKDCCKKDFNQINKYLETEGIYFSPQCIEKNVRLFLSDKEIPREGYHFLSLKKDSKLELKLIGKTVTLNYGGNRFILSENEYAYNVKELVQKVYNTGFIYIYDESGKKVDNLVSSNKYQIQIEIYMSFFNMIDYSYVSIYVDLLDTVPDVQKRLAKKLKLPSKYQPENIIIFDNKKNPITNLDKPLNSIQELNHPFYFKIEDKKKISDVEEETKPISSTEDKKPSVVKEMKSFKYLINGVFNGPKYIDVNINECYSYGNSDVLGLNNSIETIEKEEDKDKDKKGAQNNRKSSMTGFKPKTSELPKSPEEPATKRLGLYKFEFKGEIKRMKISDDSTLEKEEENIKEEFGIDIEEVISFIFVDESDDDVEERIKNMNQKMMNFKKGRILINVRSKPKIKNKLKNIKPKITPQTRPALDSSPTSSKQQQPKPKPKPPQTSVPHESNEFKETESDSEREPESERGNKTKCFYHAGNEEVKAVELGPEGVEIENSLLKAKIENLEKQLADKEKVFEEQLSKQNSEIKKQKADLDRQNSFLIEQKKEFEEQLSKKDREIERLQKEIKQATEIPNSEEIEILDLAALESFDRLEEINFGSSGKVFKVAKKLFYALKEMKSNVSTEEFKNFLHEYELLCRLHHPNIVKTFGIFLSDKTHPPSILLEFCPTNLEEWIKEKNHTKVEIVFFIFELVEGMKYVHSQKVIHRDLKPTNILIGSDGHIKISDFGISKLMSTEDQSMTGGVGTQRFMAPEILNEEEYDEKVDVYSFGVVLFFILTGGEFPKITVVQVGTGKKAPIPSSISPISCELINKCWNFKSEDRPSFTEIYDFIESNNFNLMELNESEIDEVKEKIRIHKNLIPTYTESSTK